MSFPAYAAFARDPGITFDRWRVYMALQPPTLDFHAPRDVTIHAVVEAVAAGDTDRDETQPARRPISRKSVIRALRWLTARGYLVERSRDAHGVRALTISDELPAAQAPVPHGH